MSSLGALFGLGMADRAGKAVLDRRAEEAAAKAELRKEALKQSVEGEKARRQYPTLQERASQLSEIAPGSLEEILMLEGKDPRFLLETEADKNRASAFKERSLGGKYGIEGQKTAAEIPYVGPRAEAEINEKEASANKYQAEAGKNIVQTMIAEAKANTPYELGGTGEEEGNLDKTNFYSTPPQVQDALVFTEKDGDTVEDYVSEMGALWEYAKKTGNKELQSALRYAIISQPNVFGRFADKEYQVPSLRDKSDVGNSGAYKDMYEFLSGGSGGIN